MPSVGCRVSGGRRWYGILSGVKNSPDAAPLAVPARMIQRHLIMADNAVVKVSHVDGAVWTELKVHWPEPRVIAAQKIRFFFSHPRRAVLDQRIPIDPASHDIADESVAAILLGEIVRCIKEHAGNGRRAVAVGANIRPKTQSIVRFAETRIIGPAQQLINRRAVAISGPEIPQRIEHQPKGVDLAPTVLL